MASKNDNPRHEDNNPEIPKPKLSKSGICFDKSYNNISAVVSEYS